MLHHRSWPRCSIIAHGHGESNAFGKLDSFHTALNMPIDKQFELPPSIKRKHDDFCYNDGGDPSKNGPAGVHPPKTKAAKTQRVKMSGSDLPMRTDALKQQDDYMHQYHQGKSTMELSGMGCGTCSLGVHDLPFRLDGISFIRQTH